MTEHVQNVIGVSIIITVVITYLGIQIYLSSLRPQLRLVKRIVSDYKTNKITWEVQIGHKTIWGRKWRIAQVRESLHSGFIMEPSGLTTEENGLIWLQLAIEQLDDQYKTVAVYTEVIKTVI